MALRCTEKTYQLLYWPDSHLNRHDTSRAHFGPDVPLDERGGDIYFVETSFIEELQGTQKFRKTDLYTVVDLAAKPDFVYTTTLPLFPVYGQSGMDEFGKDCFFIEIWLLVILSMSFLHMSLDFFM